MKYLGGMVDTAFSYTTALISMLAGLHPMEVGGTILLVARLISDVPPAIDAAKRMFNKR